MDQKSYTKFLEWHAKPTIDRKKENLPLSISEYCEKNNITQTELVALLDHPTFYEDILAHTINWAKSKAPELFHAYYKKIKDAPNANDFKAFMESIRPDKKDPSVNVNLNFFNIEDAQYEQIVKREARVLDSRGTPSAPELLPAHQ